MLNNSELPNDEIDGVYPLSSFTLIDQDHYEGNAVIKTKEGHYVIGGADKSRHAKLLKLDQEYNIAWEQIYDENLIHTIQCVKELEETGFLAAGYSPYLRKAFAFKTDSKGEEIWFKKYGEGSNNNRVNDFIASSDEDYLLVGHTSTDYFSSTELFLLKIDHQGDAIWTKTHARERDAEYHSIVKINHDQFIVLGSDDSSFFIDKINEKGEILSTKSYATEFSSPLDDRNMIKTNDGNLLLAITLSTEDWGTNSTIQLLKLNPDFEEIWSNKYNVEKDYSCKGVIESNDNSFLVVGSTTSYGNGFVDVLVLKIDAFGNEIWTKAYGGSAYDVATDVALKDDGGYIITGATKEGVNTNNDFFLFVLNIDRNGVPVF